MSGDDDITCSDYGEDMSGILGDGAAAMDGESPSGIAKRCDHVGELLNLITIGDLKAAYCHIQRIVRHSQDAMSNESRSNDAWSEEELQTIGTLLYDLLTAVMLVSSSDQGYKEDQSTKAVDLCMWVLSNGIDPTLFLTQLQELLPSAIQCGRVWRTVHIAYRCRDCGISESSCMCTDCFIPALHVGHDYRMYRSESGGCCDCGDPFAWKREGFCPQHGGPDKNQDLSLKLPPNLRSVAAVVIDTIIVYICDRLRVHVKRNSVGGPPNGILTAIRWAERLCRVDGLRRLLCQALQKELDETGGNIQLSDAEDLRRLRLNQPWQFAMTPDGKYPSFLKSQRPNDGSSLHRLDVFMARGILMPDATQDALGILYLQLLLDAEFKEFYTGLFVANYPSFVEVLAGEKANDKLLLNFKDYSANRDSVRDNLLDGSLADSVATKFLDRVSCQLFHNEDLCWKLVQHNDLLNLLLKSLSELIDRSLKPSLKHVAMRDVVHDSTIMSKQVYSKVLNDLRGVLAHSPVQKLFLESPHLHFELLSLLLTMQGMDPAVRAVGNHVYFETRSWRPAFILSHDVAYFMQHLLKAFRTNGCPVDVSMHSFFMLFCWLMGSETTHLTLLQLGLDSHLFGCVSVLSHAAVDVNDYCLGASDGDGTRRFRVSVDPVSFHIPLHRFCASLLHDAISLADFCNPCDDMDDHALSKICSTVCGFRVSTLSPAVSTSIDRIVSVLAAHPLRVWAFISQINGSLWVRNGHVMRQQVGCHRMRYWREHGLDLDLFLLQVAAGIISDCSIFIRSLLRTFEVDEILSLSNFGLRNILDADLKFLLALEDAVKARSQVNAAIGLIICIVSERLLCGLDARSQIRRECIQWLAVSDLTHSQLVEKISPHLVDKPDFEAVMLEICVPEVLKCPLQSTIVDGEEDGGTAALSVDVAMPAFDDDLDDAESLHDDHGTDASKSTGRKFRLRDSLWSEVDPFFSHFCRSDQQTLEHRYATMRLFEAKRACASTCAFESDILIPPYELLPTFSCFQRMVTGILNSEAVISLIAAVLMRALLETKEVLVDEMTLYGAIYLLGLAAQVAAKHSPCLSVGRAGGDIFTARDTVAMLKERTPLLVLGSDHQPKSVLEILLLIYGNSKFEAHRECIAYVFKTLSSVDADIGALWTNVLVSNESARKAEAERQERMRVAKQRQADAMAVIQAQMAAFEENFRDELCDDDECPVPGASEDKGDGDGKQETKSDGIQSMEGIVPEGESGVAFEGSDGDDMEGRPDGDCALCLGSDAKDAGATLCDVALGGTPETRVDGPMGIVAYVQESKLLAYMYARAGDEGELEDIVGTSSRPLPASSHMHIQSCGHVLHVNCLLQYLRSLRLRLRRGESIEGERSVSLSEGEFLCPACRRLCNVIVPSSPCPQLGRFLTWPSPVDSASADVVMDGSPHMSPADTIAMLDGFRHLAPGFDVALTAEMMATDGSKAADFTSSLREALAMLWFSMSHPSRGERVSKSRRPLADMWQAIAANIDMLEVASRSLSSRQMRLRSSHSGKIKTSSSLPLNSPLSQLSSPLSQDSPTSSPVLGSAVSPCKLNSASGNGPDYDRAPKKSVDAI